MLNKMKFSSQLNYNYYCESMLDESWTIEYNNDREWHVISDFAFNNKGEKIIGNNLYPRYFKDKKQCLCYLEKVKKVMVNLGFNNAKYRIRHITSEFDYK